jgi:hypothetical protein
MSWCRNSKLLLCTVFAIRIFPDMFSPQVRRALYKFCGGEVNTIKQNRGLLLCGIIIPYVCVFAVFDCGNTPKTG